MKEIWRHVACYKLFISDTNWCISTQSFQWLLWSMETSSTFHVPLLFIILFPFKHTCLSSSTRHGWIFHCCFKKEKSPSLAKCKQSPTNGTQENASMGILAKSKCFHLVNWFHYTVLKGFFMETSVDILKVNWFLSVLDTVRTKIYTRFPL